MYGQASITYNGPAAASSGGNPPGVTNPFMGFAVGDGQDGSPSDGQTTLQVATLVGQPIADTELLVIREGIQLLWNTAVAVNNIRRFNSGGLAGWTFEGGLSFQAGERYQVFIIGINTTVET
jgi:hypothetical protein